MFCKVFCWKETPHKNATKKRPAEHHNLIATKPNCVLRVNVNNLIKKIKTCKHDRPNKLLIKYKLVKYIFYSVCFLHQDSNFRKFLVFLLTLFHANILPLPNLPLSNWMGWTCAWMQALTSATFRLTFCFTRDRMRASYTTYMFPQFALEFSLINCWM